MPTHQHLVDKMRRHSCFVFLFCGIFLPGILGFPQTNTSIDCDSLLPNYEAEPQTSAPPYIIAVSFDNFEPGNEVQVTLEALGDAGFKGFNLQAREIDGDVPVGTFKITDPNTKGLECHNMTNSAVSHANSDVKQKVTTTWIAPQDAREIQFIATVVQNLENFWVGIQSKTLTPIHSVSVNATGKSKRKLMIELECNKRGGTYSTGRCIMVGPSSSSQNSYSGSQGGVVYTISKSGCVPGGAAGAYGLQACRDSASLSGGGLTYGQSVPSSSSDSSKKVVVVANSNPFPPVRHTFPQSLGSSATRIIVQSGQKQQTSSSTYVQGSQGSQSYSQGYRPQSGSSYSQGGPGFSGSSSSYGQGSQGSQSYGQGYQPQGGSSYGQQGGSASYGGSSGCGQGVSYDSNPCHQGGSQGGQGGSYSSQNYGGSQQSGSSYSQSYSDNQDGSYSQNYGGGQGGSSSDTYYENQDSQDFSDDSNPNACDDNDTTYSAKNQRSGCAKKKVLVARDTSHVLSRRAYDVQNASSPSNSSQSDIQGGSFIATSGSSNQGGCICPDGSSGHRQGAPGSSYSTYSGNQGGPFFYPGGSYGQGGPSFYPGGSYGQGAPGSSYSTYSGNQGGPFFYPGGSYGQGGPGSSHSSYYGNQGGPSFYPGGSYGQGGSSAYDGSSESYGQGGSSTYSGSDAYGQDSLSIGGSETEDSDSALPTGDGQSERDFYSPGGSQSGGHGSSSQSGSYASGQDSSSSGSSQYGGQGSPSSGGSQSGGQGGCDCSGGSSGGSPSLVRSDSSANDSSSSGGSQYNSQESSSYGGSQYGGQGSPSSGGSQYGGQGSPSSGGSQYGGQDPSLPGGSHYGGQGIASSGSSQYSGQGFSSGVRQSGGQGSYSGSNQYGGQGSYPSGSSQYGGQGGRPSGGRPHGKPGSSSSGGSHQGKPGGSGSGSTYSGKPQSPYSGGSQVSSAGKHSTPQLLMLFSVLSAFALSAAVSKWSI
ncbi:hornerin-like isoform X21 [Corvus kubaryi]|uniref:hornerin-like isoform X21 n=1 Tax=Corvus kubaryi TaxID=68294 RepID=UPI001C04BF0D|nr:hornerin-like isoform X21 [Corvus kubaryi]